MIEARNRHLTLAFLGEIDTGEQHRVDEALLKVSEQQSPLTLQFGRLECFPDARSRILAARCPLTEALQQLQSSILLLLLPGVSTRPYRPHITLARLKVPLQGFNGSCFDSQTVNVDHVTLFRSHLSSAGSQYSIVKRYPFTGRHG